MWRTLKHKTRRFTYRYKLMYTKFDSSFYKNYIYWYHRNTVCKYIY